jgi:HicB family
MDKATQIHVRLTPQLHRKLVREAKRGGLTLNAEILKRLESSFEGPAFLEKYLKLVAEQSRAVSREESQKFWQQLQQRQAKTESTEGGNDDGQRN